MPQSYTLEFKKKIVRLHLEEGHTYKSITAEYGVSKAGISKWCAKFNEECQKGKSLLKKSGGILCKGNRLEAYRFIEQFHDHFGLRWLLRRLNLCSKHGMQHNRFMIFFSHICA